jgi:hypothetical protein
MCEKAETKEEVEAAVFSVYPEYKLKTEKIYEEFFNICRTFGVLPYEFNELRLTKLSSGASYYFYLFNAGYSIIATFKIGMLFLLNWYNGFKFEELNGGYFLQVAWFLGHLIAFSASLSWCSNTETFASTITSWIQLERQIAKGTGNNNSEC